MPNNTMMPSRLFCPQPLAAGQVVALTRAAAHHAVHVLRLALGDPVILFDGAGGEYAGTIVTLAGGVEVALSDHLSIERESPLQVVLVQSLVATDKMDWLVQKAVELGVAALVPLEAQRCVVRLGGERAAKRIEHLRQVVIAACEQCGRNRVPEVAPLMRLPQFLAAQTAHDGLRLMLAPGATRRLLELAPEQRRIVLLVGPEGGFSDTERQAAEATGFMAASLGPRILRTETAGLAALAALQARFGDF